MSKKLWEELLEEADKDKDGKITFQDFSLTMNEIRRRWLRKDDRSPSPVKRY